LRLFKLELLSTEAGDKMSGISCSYDSSWLKLLTIAPDMKVLIEAFVLGNEDDMSSLGPIGIRRCGAYRPPKVDVTNIATFAGPVLYREMFLLDRETFEQLEMAELKATLHRAGWTRDVLSSLGRNWLAKMVMLEELWKREPSFATLPDREWGANRGMRFRIGPNFSHPNFSELAASIVVDKVSEVLRSIKGDRLTFGLAVGRSLEESKKPGKLDSLWYMFFGEESVLVDMRMMVDVVNAIISDPRTQTDASSSLGC
jgi:hypothetical protein